METVREIDARERQAEKEREIKQQELLEQQEKAEKEAYAQKIREERIELMRLKQGVITESETIHEEQEEKKHSAAQNHFFVRFFLCPIYFSHSNHLKFRV